MRLGSSTAPISLVKHTLQGPSLSVGHNNSAWNPGLANPTFWLDPSVSSTLTLSGNTITQAVSKSGGSLTLSQVNSSALPVLHSNAINGYPSVRTSVAGGEKLFAVGGPAMGMDLPANIYAVAQIYASAGSTYPVFASLGDPSATNFKTMFLGARLTQWAAYAQANPLGAVGGTVDSSPHVFGFEYDGAGNFTVRVDGVVIAGPTASATFKTSQNGFPSGLGIQVAANGFNGSVDVCDCIWRCSGVADSAALRIKHEQYLGNRFNITLPDLIAGSGDSLTYGSFDDNYPTDPGDPTHSYLALLPNQTGMGSWTFTAYNDGHPGWTTAQLLAATGALTVASPLRKNNLSVLFIGTNDMNGAIAPATILANIASIYANLLTAGFQNVIVCTLFPWNGWNAANLTTVNNGIKNTYPYVADLAGISALLTGLSVVGGGWTGTYDDVYRCGSGGAAGHLTATGENLVSSFLAPILLSLKK